MDLSEFQILDDFSLTPKPGSMVLDPPSPAKDTKNPSGALPPVETPDVTLPPDVWLAITDIVETEGPQQLILGEDPAEPPGPLSSDEIEDKWQTEVISLLRESDCYEFYAVEIGLGANTSKFKDFTHTGMSTQVNESLRRINARSQSFPMMKGLVEADKILKKIRIKAQKKMSFTGYSWLATEANYPEVAEIIEYELKGTANNLRVALMSRYEGEFRAYLASVADVLLGAIADLKAKGEEPFDFNMALAHYADQFPSRKDVATKLKISVIGPKRIRKLSDQAQHAADLEEAIATFEAASLQAEANSLEKRRLEAQKQLLLDEQTAGRRAIARAMEWAEGRMLEAFDDFFSRFKFKNLKPGDLTPQREASIAQALEEIEAVMGKPGTGGFTHLLEECKQLSGMAYDSSKTKADIEAKIIAMREALNQSVKPATGGVGHRAFAGVVRRKPN